MMPPTEPHPTPAALMSEQAPLESRPPSQEVSPPIVGTVVSRLARQVGAAGIGVGFFAAMVVFVVTALWGAQFLLLGLRLNQTELASKGVMTLAASSLLLFQLSRIRDRLARRGWASNVIRRARTVTRHG